MKNLFFTIGICFFVFGIGLTSCNLKKMTKSAGSINVSDENLVDKKWKLTEINGVVLSTMNPQPAVETFIIFQTIENRVNGNSGCNNFTGTYKTGQGNSLNFSGVASTRKMCIDMTIEDQMNKIFQTVDNYTLQGGILSLNQAGKTLAKFVLSE